ncbi:MAG: ornithine cyclodeaminase family protein, partial [Boseongicola sp.]|nr:ornithine cyclodeaminase family protein [Boseongicola sp.]
AVIWARDADKAAEAARDCADALGISVEPAEDRESAVASADVIVTTTPATEPILMAGWLRPGQHVTAMGSDQPGKSELDPDCLSRADLYVADRLSQTREMGELRAAIDAGTVPRDFGGEELGEVLIGTIPGRTDPGQITIADLTGTGVQDTAIATHAIAAFNSERRAT